MKSSFNISLSVLILWMLCFSCKDNKTPTYDSEMNESIVINLKNNDFDNPMDSVTFLVQLGNQKLQEVYDIASWQAGSIDKDSILYKQLLSYFSPEDTMSIKNLIAELDSVGVQYSRVYQLKLLEKDSLDNDSVGKMLYKVNYFDKDKNFIKTRENQISYNLKKNPEKLKKQFSFYFYNLSEKDTIASGVKQ